MNSIQMHGYKWHAVYLRYRTEKKVSEELSFKNIQSFLPLKISKRYWSDRVKMISEPLFPSYIFVKVHPKDYLDVLTISGVLKFVAFEGKVVEISEEKIESLMLFVERVNEDIELATGRLQKGQRVMISKGPLKNIVGEILQIKDKKYIILRFTELGFDIQVDLGKNEVELLRENVRLETV